MELQEPEFELSAGGKFQGNFDEGKGNLVGVIRISGVKMTEKRGMGLNSRLSGSSS